MSRPHRERGAIDPRQLVRPLRYLIVIAIVCVGWVTWSGFEVLRLPAGVAVLFDFPPAVQVIVARIEGDPEVGHAVVYAKGDGSVGYGRVVAMSDDPLELDRDRGRVRVGQEAWFPAPATLFRSLPLQTGELLVLAENPEAREEGGVVPIAAVVARIVTALPF